MRIDTWSPSWNTVLASLSSILTMGLLGMMAGAPDCVLEPRAARSLTRTPVIRAGTTGPFRQLTGVTVRQSYIERPMVITSSGPILSVSDWSLKSASAGSLMPAASCIVTTCSAFHTVAPPVAVRRSFELAPARRHEPRANLPVGDEMSASLITSPASPPPVKPGRRNVTTPWLIFDVSTSSLAVKVSVRFEPLPERAGA
mmetsp:Transcript_66379/g.163561  ORF Transcript_66379/g.163561 Transcript_66379/m.163561 type:complete len:200 (-) Transcript_66379:1586-2185(-)